MKQTLYSVTASSHELINKESSHAFSSVMSMPGAMPRTLVVSDSIILQTLIRRLQRMDVVGQSMCAKSVDEKDFGRGYHARLDQYK